MTRSLRVALLALAASPMGLATASPAAEIWSAVAPSTVESAGESSDRFIRPATARYFQLETGALAALLAIAPDEISSPRGMEGVALSIPFPDGSVRHYRVVDSPIMEPGLAAKFPEIHTFRLIDVKEPQYTGRGDWTMTGFHAAVRTPDGMVYVDPVFRGNADLHQTYFRRDLAASADSGFRCEFETENEALLAELATTPPAEEALTSLGGAGGIDLRTYRLAVAATVEYTTFHGGTVPLAQAAIVVAVNRVNEIYEHDMAIRMILVANNNLVVFTAEPDGYTNNSGGTMLGENTTILNTVIGSANYDIGHVFSTGGGGVATLNGPCGGSKARGVTGLSAPTGDPFYIDYVAHEMGHQWGGQHSFNGSSGNCSGGNRTAATAYEPGSGSTIMAYAGICGAQNLQPNSDPYFHRVSLNQIQAFSRTGNGNNCDLLLAQDNAQPVVEAGPSYTIPISTPFALTGSASDPDGGSVTYLWEQWDLGAAGAPGSPVGNAPIFRSFNPVSIPVRIFPKVEDLLDNTPTIGEILPTYARTLNFRLTAFDGDTPAGAEGVDSTSVVVTDLAGPFLVTAPNTAVTWTGSGPHMVTWNVANTTAAPVLCPLVDVNLLGLGGLNLDSVLAVGVLNDGSTPVYVGTADTTVARIQVKCENNIFFDVSNANFTITDADDLLFADGFESNDVDLWSDSVS